MIILILQWLAILFFTALIHESGHALACRYYKIPVLQMMVFSGTAKHSLRFGRFLIGWLPYGGYVVTPFISCSRKDFIITIWGPAANFIVGTGALFTTGMLKVFFVFNLVMAINAMLPISKQKDGYRLLKILQQWQKSKS
ncbi:MAG: site-2 protease family protein [Ferruginibacter sp.]